jgi:molecular chaperone Hsp33
MSETPAFLDLDRPAVPDIVVPRGIVPFHMPGRHVRGRLIRLGPLTDAMLTRREQPYPVAKLTGEALALVAGLSAALKFRGSFSLQVRGDGPVTMLLADCTDQGALRGYALLDREKLALLGEAAPDAASLLGQGHFALTVDQGSSTEQYQGIVSITGPTLAAMAQHYFATSEQLRAHLYLACARTASGWRAGALVLERISEGGGIAAPEEDTEGGDGWQTALALAATLTEAELLDDALGSHDLLYRLFGTEGVAVDQARALSYGCRCSRAKLLGVLGGFGAGDLDHMETDGSIAMTCEFCNLEFRFARAEVRGS